MRCFLLAALLIGCGNAKLPNQDQAIRSVWYEVYQETDDPPAIYWVDTLNCHNQEAYYQGRIPGSVSNSGLCIAGAYWSFQHWIDLAHNSDIFSETAFSHELLHAHLYHLNGSGDGGHTLPEWGSSQGKPANLWDYAQETLIANGL